MDGEATSSGAQAGTGVRRDLRWLSLTLVGAVVGTFLLGDVLAHTSPVIPNHVRSEIDRQREVDGVWLYDHGYLDDADYLLLGQIPNADYSRGGVYFIGDSQTAVALMAWRLPPDERELIHNYGVGALRHRDVYHLVRMLVEDFDLLQAGAEKTTIVLGASYYLSRPPIPGVTLAYYVERHHLYSYDARGMHPVPMSPIQRAAIMERDRVQRFLAIMGGRESRVTVHLTDQQTPEGRVLEGDWRASFPEEIAYLRATIDYLKSRNVNVIVFLPASGSWDDAVPYEAAYRAAALPMLQEEGVRVVDEGDWIADPDFADGNHPTYSAQLGLHERNRAIAVNALDEMGLR